MTTPRETVLALNNIFSMQHRNNPFPLENILIYINNELPLDDKFCTTREISVFIDSVASYYPVYGGSGDNRVSAIRKFLDYFWHFLETETYNINEFPDLVNYFNSINKKISKISKEDILVDEGRQWSFIRNNYLNNAREQIIFNYKPAEIGDNKDTRTKELRRDLMNNLGLVVGLDYVSIDDLRTNRVIKCNYVFVVPTIQKAEDLWIGIMKEQVRMINDMPKLLPRIKQIPHDDIFALSFKKLYELCNLPYKITGNTLFEMFNVSVNNLNPINVFTAPAVYCWAPTVVLTTYSEEKCQRGFIIFQESDAGVAEMTGEAIMIWRDTILRILTDDRVCKKHNMDPTQIFKRKAEILGVIQA